MADINSNAPLALRDAGARARIRRLFASYGLTLLEWEKRRTDMLTIQESGVAFATTQPQ